MAKGFKYRGGRRTVEEVSRQSKQSGGGFDSYLDPECTFLKVREGDVQLRILPGTWEVEGDAPVPWHYDIWVHYNVGPDNGVYLCPAKMKNESCPICDARHDNEDDADALRVSRRVLAWVIDRDNERAGPQVFSIPNTLFRDICNHSIDKKHDEVILIDDPEQGYDIMFTREGSDKKTKYTGVEVAREPTSIHEDEKKQEAWLDFIADHSLPDMLVFFDAAHVEKVLYGRAERKGRDDDDDKPPRRSRLRSEEDEEVEDRGGSRRSRARDDDDDRPSRASRRDEDDEDDRKPPRRSRASEPDEEEEDERPTRRGRKSEPAEDDDVPFEGEREGRGRGRPTAPAKDEEEDERPVATKRYAPQRGASKKEAGDEAPRKGPTEQARERLGKLSGKRGR